MIKQIRNKPTNDHSPKTKLLQRIEEELFEKQLEVRIYLQKSS